MKNPIINSDNIFFVVLGIITVAVLVFGVMLISNSALPSLTDEEKLTLLTNNLEHTRGNKDAKIRLISFSDFQCSHCRDFARIETELVKKYGDRVFFVSRMYLLNFGNPGSFVNGPVAAYAAEAAGVQGKYFEMHDLIFEKQTEWIDLTIEEAQNKYVQYATEIGVDDLSKFTTDMKNSINKDKLLSDFDDAEKLGVEATPTIFINSTKFNVREMTVEEFSKKLDEALEAL